MHWKSFVRFEHEKSVREKNECGEQKYNDVEKCELFFLSLKLRVIFLSLSKK